VRFVGVDDRTAAEGLRGVLLSVPRLAREVDLPPDEFYDSDLEGLAVRDRAGVACGVVHEVIHLPGHDLLACRLSDDREVLIPFVSAIVPVVDVAAGYVVIEPPDGLLDPEDGPS
jgi:16S rRNA processing protein RimM